MADISSIVVCSLCSNEEFGYSPEAISKQCVEGTGWLLLAACWKMWKKRDNLKEEPLSRKKPGLGDLRNSQLIWLPRHSLLDDVLLLWQAWEVLLILIFEKSAKCINTTDPCILILCPRILIILTLLALLSLYNTAIHKLFVLQKEVKMFFYGSQHI